MRPTGGAVGLHRPLRARHDAGELAAAGGHWWRMRSPIIGISCAPTRSYRAPSAQERAALEELHGWLAGPGAERPCRGDPVRALRDRQAPWFRQSARLVPGLYEVLLGQSEGPRFGTFVAIYGAAETRALIEAAPCPSRPRRHDGARPRPPPASPRSRARGRPEKAWPGQGAAGRRPAHQLGRPPDPMRRRIALDVLDRVLGPDHRPFDETFQGHPQLDAARGPRPGLRPAAGDHGAAPAGPDRSYRAPAAPLSAEGADASPTCCAWVRPSSCSSRRRRTRPWPRPCASRPAASGARCRCSTPCCASSPPRAASCSKARTPRSSTRPSGCGTAGPRPTARSGPEKSRRRIRPSHRSTSRSARRSSAGPRSWVPRSCRPARCAGAAAGWSTRCRATIMAPGGCRTPPPPCPPCCSVRSRASACSTSAPPRAARRRSLPSWAPRLPHWNGRPGAPSFSCAISGRLTLDAEIVVADALEWQRARPLSRVLLDAPCTATGTIRRHPDVPWAKSPADVARLAEAQARLLEAAVGFLDTGGVLVYAVCSLQPEEGPQRIEALLAAGRRSSASPSGRPSCRASRSS